MFCNAFCEVGLHGAHGRHTATALRVARIDLASPRKSGRDSADVGTSCSP